jgi:Uma2 family endonuclease
MVVLILDEYLEQRLHEERKARGVDRWDEVWDGVYRILPPPDVEHQKIVSRLVVALGHALEGSEGSDLLAGTNVSDRTDNWMHNFRCPDVAVFLPGTSASNHDAFWHGGPDFAVEITSPGDDTREKIPFYATVGTRELLIVERDPWSLELFRLAGEKLISTGTSDLAHSRSLSSQVVPFTFRLVAGSPRPHLEVTATATGESRLV